MYVPTHVLRTHTLQDLSSLTNGFPSFGSSMNATNMVSADPAGKLPSTSSEATDGVKLGNPNLDIPGTFDATNTVHADGHNLTGRDADSWAQAYSDTTAHDMTGRDSESWNQTYGEDH